MQKNLQNANTKQLKCSLLHRKAEKHPKVVNNDWSLPINTSAYARR